MTYQHRLLCSCLECWRQALLHPAHVHFRRRLIHKYIHLLVRKCVRVQVRAYVCIVHTCVHACACVWAFIHGLRAQVN